MKKVSRIFPMIFITGILLGSVTTHACRWDADTLANEKKKKPELAEIIFGTGKEVVDVPRLQKRIAELKANPRHEDPDWWNNFAGAYIQLGEPQKAAALLEPVLEQFKNDYGVHANLGTAYHLLGRYKEAEKEISRDLEINPDAHFGLEKYHLALLQYLCRDEEYQKQHVYVDEWSELFLERPVEGLSDVRYEANALPDIAKLSKEDTNSFSKLPQWQIEHIGKVSLPPYSSKWNLAADPKFEEGIRYMATLNPKQPACFTMLGIVCATHRNFNLASSAFEKAIALNSPQKEILEKKLNESKDFIRESHQQKSSFRTVLEIGAFVLIAILVCVFLFLFRKVFRN